MIWEGFLNCGKVPKDLEKASAGRLSGAPCPDILCDLARKETENILLALFSCKPSH